MTTLPKPGYWDQLGDKLEVVIRQSQDRRKQLEEFINAVQKRIETEETYAKNLEVTGKLLDRFVQQKSTVTLTYSAFKADHAHRSEQSRSLAQQLRDEVLNMLRECLNNQNNEYKKLEKDARKCEKDMQAYIQTLTRSKERYLNSDRRRQQQQIVNEIVKVSSEPTTDKKQKQNSLTKDIEKETREYEQVYRLATKQYNDYLENYNAEMRKVFIKLQEHEEHRIERQVDSIMKMLVFETSMMRNFDYDISNISKQMEGVKAETDINAFIQANRSPSGKFMPEIPPPGSTFLNVSITRVMNKSFDVKIQQFQNNKAIKGYLDSLVKGQEPPKELTLTPSEQLEAGKLHGLISACWKPRQLTPEEISSLKELAFSEKCRHFFSMLLKQHSVHLGVQLMAAGLENAAVLLEIILEKCLQTRDVFTARKLLAISFRLWTQDRQENGKQEESKLQQKLLSLRIQNLLIWKYGDFWEAAIFESVQEELKMSAGSKGETLQDAISREKNIVFGQLALFCNWMLLLGSYPKLVRQIVGRYCRLYELSEDQSKDLSKAINNSSKQYREMTGKMEPANLQDSKLG